MIEGYVKQYFLKDGIEKTTNFFTEAQTLVFLGYENLKPSDFYLTCEKDTTVIVGSPEKEVEMMKNFLKLEDITRNVVEADFGKTQEKLNSFITSTPEKRYLNLMKSRPELIQRVPQHQLASYW